ncbi:hydroxyurea phosphotransferase [Ktedonobacter sp. SOSP1-52]|uniref:aminoglycoside phosphotransferase family protein n=1 Tax=Ktedonobacter sp. SOSP1-52 TaxID=2778366 RepID=UPI0019158F59|nr:aminoglycoside phosphotransferase family protein [Ktedonobacter sp. SOSP1-52]GHO62075.1 hydroxyurea phosphotransferase [Ktedonobacter sp. SOSP1-52]
MITIPPAFQRFMFELHKDEGQAWLERLPRILATCAELWGLVVEEPFSNLSFHYVTRARRRADNTPVVLKACSPTGEFRMEAATIAHYEGHGMVRLLDTFPEGEVMLLESLTPGKTLNTLTDDEQATRYAARVMRQLWRPAPEQHNFPSVADWGRGVQRLHQQYDGGYGPFPPHLLDEAEHLYAELTASMATPMLLHGDLHHDNILQAEREPWLAIDPKGLIGEPAYETGALLRNPLPDLLHRPNPGRIQKRRVAILSEELGIDRARIRDWGLAQCVLSAWWTIEDTGQYPADTIACAQLLADIKV